MSSLPLRDYQARSLDALEHYLGQAVTDGPKRAFVLETERVYHSVPQLPDLPYVCLRVPTGGGKTIMAAHAVGIAADKWVQRDRVTCLWLVPSNAIREQTLARLRAEGDPYREALASRFDGPVTVMDLSEALYVQRGTLDGETVVIVATLAALRVSDTEGRKVYEQNGALEHHFTGLAPELLQGLERRADGTPVESLANVLRLRRPVVIMDEAHNARTTLSFETLERVRPSCIVEFTATPDTKHDPERGHFASNVLAHVSAAELKAEEMIKLPVKLWTRGAWTDAITDALAKQRELEEIAAAERQRTGERIRPIVLFQAQPRRQGEQTITADVLRQSLIDDHHVPPEQIAIETGSTRELDGMDLNEPACPIRFVITVQALREGWDCPTAYVLCSVAEQTTSRAVEQILGRVLRLPGARRKSHEALNTAYAYVVSNNFAHAAEGLRDALVENGFERYEAHDLVEAGPETQAALFYPLLATPLSRRVNEKPNYVALDALVPELRAAVHFDDATSTLTIHAALPEEAVEQLAGCFPTPQARSEVRELALETRRAPHNARAETGGHAELVMPQLAIRVNGTLELFDESHILGAPWRLAECDATLTDAEFSLHVAPGHAGQLDVSAQGKLQISFRDDMASELSLLEGEPGWTVAALAVWLDRHIPHPAVTQSDAQLFIHHALTALMERAGVTVEQLAREKYRLRRALDERIARHEATQRRTAFQHALFEDGAGEIVVTPMIGVVLGDPDRYAPNSYYEGPYRFQKHLFPHVGELDSGEEQECAVYLDQHPFVECWVRNIARRDSSFWLQTATDRYFPDFVGRLTDGRVFAVEYKGEHLWSADDAKEKRAVGELWAARSNGQCIHFMPKGTDWGAIDAAFRGPRDR